MPEKSEKEQRLNMTWQFRVLVTCGLLLAAAPWVYMSYAYKTGPQQVVGELSLMSVKIGVKRELDARIAALSEKVERGEETLRSEHRADFARTREQLSDLQRAVERIHFGDAAPAAKAEARPTTPAGKVEEKGSDVSAPAPDRRKSLLREPAAAGNPLDSATAAFVANDPLAFMPRAGSQKPLAFVTAITSRSDDYIASALVLQESVRLHGGKYTFEYVALVPADETEGWESLVERGWHVVPAPMPVDVAAIKGPLKHSIVKSGCCGPSELIKLKLFDLEDYRRVLFFDADALVLAPLDDLVETDATLWTQDIGLGGGCINGGFLATTPSAADYRGLVATVLEGDFDNGGRAWGKSGIGYCYGGQTFQGVVPYYFQKVKKVQWKNMDTFEYNNMGKDSPKPGKDVPYHGSIDGVRSVHFTWCQKPWRCHVQQTDVCLAFHKRFWDDLKHGLSRGPNPALDKLKQAHDKCPKR